MSENKNNNEEVDLGSLFIIIGRGLSKVFYFFKSLIIKIFDSIILILLFLRKNLLKIGIGTIIGAMIGFGIEFSSKTKYKATLQVKPNFNSTRQLYNSIGYFDDLVKQKDTILLAKTFGISVNEATSLKKFEVNPIINENDILNAYDKLIRKVDTTTVKSYSYEKFKNMFTKYDYSIQEISVEATKNDLFTKLTTTIVNSITNNDYFKKVKQITNENLNRSNTLLKKNLIQADSLHSIYKEVLLTEAKKNKSGTSINMGSSKASNKEIQLFNTNKQLNNELSRVSKEISEKSEVINIISDFQPIGHKVDEIQKNKTFQMGFLGALIVVFILLLLMLNTFLNNFKR